MYIRVLIEGNAKWRMLLSATKLIPEDSLWIIQIIMWCFDLISVMCFRITRRHSKTNYFRSTEPRLRRLCTTNRYIIACVKSLRKKKNTVIIDLSFYMSCSFLISLTFLMSSYDQKTTRSSWPHRFHSPENGPNRRLRARPPGVHRWYRSYWSAEHRCDWRRSDDDPGHLPSPHSEDQSWRPNSWRPSIPPILSILSCLVDRNFLKIRSQPLPGWLNGIPHMLDSYPKKERRVSWLRMGFPYMFD